MSSITKTRMLSLLAFIVLTGSSFCQSDQEKIQDWANKNPNVLLIEKSNFEQFTLDEISKLNSMYIVYTNELRFEDIENYITNTTNSNANSSANTNNTNADELKIKTWVKSHPHIKIVKHSEYVTEPSDIQREYKTNGCLILSGEEITVEDINNYTH